MFEKSGGRAIAYPPSRRCNAMGYSAGARDTANGAQLSQESNTKLADIAVQVIDSRD
jgi:hypothetical protein